VNNLNLSAMLLVYVINKELMLIYFYMNNIF